MLLVTLLAIHRPIPIGLEGNLGLLAAFGTDNIGHLSWGPIKAAPAASFTIHLVLSPPHWSKESIRIHRHPDKIL
jgi:hypothetical protein